MTPRLEEKVKLSGGKIKLLKINIDKFGKIAQSFQIKAVPTIYLVFEGKAVDTFSGEISDEKLDKFLESASRVSQGNLEEDKVAQALEEAKTFLNSRDYPGAESVLVAIKYAGVPE